MKIIGVIASLLVALTIIFINVGNVSAAMTGAEALPKSKIIWWVYNVIRS